MTMKHFLLSAVGVASVGLVLAHLACSSDDTAATASADGGSEAAADDTIVIGVDLALTGTLAPFGKNEQEATRVAQTQINSLGGILGRKVHFEIIDDGTDTAKTKTAMETFLGKKYPVILGPTGSGQASDVQKLAAGAFTLAISPSASTPVTREAEPALDRYFFRTAASHGLQAKALAIRATRGFGGAGPDGGAPATCKKVALITQDDAYGNPIATGFSAQLAAGGGAVVIEKKVPVTPKANYDTEAAEIVAAVPDCQVVISFPDVAAAYMRSFKKSIAANVARDWSTFISIGSNGVKNDQTLVKGRENPNDPASPTSVEGMYVMNFDLSPKTPQANEFKNVFVLSNPGSDANADLPGYAANQYDAAILACLAIQRAGTATDLKKIRDALFEVSRPPGTAYSAAKLSDALVATRAGQDIDYDGASGPVDFDDYGEVLADFVVFKVNAGKFEAVPEAGLLVADLK
jgi:branched-chain amino acid transport system substrate-binding protein